jgi:ABC-2 type transport system ATP-binding protein
MRPLVQTNAIEVRGLTKRFGAHLAVDDLSFSVAPGEMFGFLGPNGAGKTTTIRMLTGLLRPTSGTVLVAGYDVLRRPLEAKRRTGYVPDGPFLYPKLSGWEFLSFIADLYGVPRATAHSRSRELVALFDLEGAASDLIEGYSHGMRQKLALAATLLHEPQVIVLDEPISGLDPRSARIVKDLLTALADRGRTVLFSTHILEIAENLCDRVGIIDRGRLVAIGSLHELRGMARAGEASLEEIFLQLTGGAENRELAAFLKDG